MTIEMTENGAPVNGASTNGHPNGHHTIPSTPAERLAARAEKTDSHLTCALCGKDDFRTARGLTHHINVVHTEDLADLENEAAEEPDDGAEVEIELAEA